MVRCFAFVTATLLGKKHIYRNFTSRLNYCNYKSSCKDDMQRSQRRGRPANRADQDSPTCTIAPGNSHVPITGTSSSSENNVRKRHQTDPIRARYLHSLNVASSEPPLNTSPKRNHCSSRLRSSSQIEKIPIHHEPLKDDNAKVDADLVSALSSCSLSSTSSSKDMPPTCIITRQADSTDLKYIFPAASTSPSSSTSMSPFSSSSNIFAWERTYSRQSFSSLNSMSSSFDIEDDETSTTSSKKQRGVSFDATVSIKPIPTRNEYSNRIKPYLWSTPQELQQNARRNIFEFASEHYDWQRAVEESDMYIHAETGERIHPIHVQAAAARAQRAAAATVNSSRDHFIDMSRNKAAQN